MTPTSRKLIEVALPLEAINEEGSRRKRKAPAGYPTTLHKWWAQRPIAAARAVIFAQMVDDPSARPDIFPTEKKQDKERQRLFTIIENLVKWENTKDERILQAARDEISQSWRNACAANADPGNPKGLFDRQVLPAFLDPFAGSGAIPLEAQRLGLHASASDLNPVAVLINKATIELPSRFRGKPPVNPSAAASLSRGGSWPGASGLAEDVRYYGKWIRDEAERRIGALYPKVHVSAGMVRERPDLRPCQGKELDVIAYIWARTVKSPNPAFAKIDVPLASTFMLSNKSGKEAYIEPLISGASYAFRVRTGTPKDPPAAKRGTKSGGSHSVFECLFSKTPMPFEYLRDEAKAGRMGMRLMAVVAQGDRGRVFLSPTPEIEEVASRAKPDWSPDVDISHWPGRTNVVEYGLTTFGSLFTPRQLVALNTFSELIQDVRARVQRDATVSARLPVDEPLRAGGKGALAYAEAVSVYLAFALSRMADYGSQISTWRPKDNAMRSTLAKQAIPMTWDFAEGSPFGDSSSGFIECVEVIAKVLVMSVGCALEGHAAQADAATGSAVDYRPVISTDPPYYSNVGYADLSDFFYVWLRRTLRPIYPDLFSTVAVPKAEELIASPYRHGSEEKAESFFLDGMTKAMHQIAGLSHPAFPVTIYYAFKQSETEGTEGTASTGWETFLAAVIRAGFAITGTWPMRTEGDNRQASIGANALASSIVLVCRHRDPNASAISRREFVAELRSELPKALTHLQRGNVAPVDLAQAAVGPGMAVFTKYARVLDATGEQLSVRDALTLINQILDEALTAQEGDFDSDSRWALAWFEHAGFSEGEFGVAEILTKAKNTSVAGLVEAGILKAGRGKVRLLKASELQAHWDPSTDSRLTAWETVHHLVRSLQSGGELGAAALVAKLGAKAESARELAYRLYTVCERKRWAPDALAYNGLVQSWPEITRLAREGGQAAKATQSALFANNEE